MSRVTVSNSEFKEKLKDGWLFPSGMARRWGLAEITVWAGIKAGRFICVHNVSGVCLMDPKQSIAGNLVKSKEP